MLCGKNAAQRLRYKKVILNKKKKRIIKDLTPRAPRERDEGKCAIKCHENLFKLK
jgi:hypothetical protein